MLRPSDTEWLCTQERPILSQIFNWVQYTLRGSYMHVKFTSLPFYDRSICHSHARFISLRHLDIWAKSSIVWKDYRQQTLENLCKCVLLTLRSVNFRCRRSSVLPKNVANTNAISAVEMSQYHGNEKVSAESSSGVEKKNRDLLDVSPRVYYKEVRNSKSFFVIRISSLS